MKSLAWQASVRFLTHHPWQLLLALFGVMLGVAVVVSMDLAKTCAFQSFERAREALFGRVTHRIDTPFGLSESLYRNLRRAGFVRLRPVLEGLVELAESGQRLKVLGVDPLAELRFAPAWMDGLEGAAGNWRRLLLESGSVLLDRKTGEMLGLVPGDKFAVRAGTRHLTLQVAGWFESGQEPLGAILIADISTAQETLNALGQLSAIDIIASGPSEIQELKTFLPVGVELVTREAGSRSVKRMTEAFYTSLTALSLLSLLVGAFLIYNVVSFMTVQRLPLFGILRVLGVTRWRIQVQILSEAALLGAVGSLLGLMGGSFLGRFMLTLLTRTLNDVYFPLPTTELELSPWLMTKGALLGVGVTLAAASGSALEASRIDPITVLARSVQESRARSRLLPASILGLELLFAGGSLPRFSGNLVGGFLALTAMVVGCALLVPLLTRMAMGAVQAISGTLFGIWGKMPARAVSASLSRTGVAAAALMVAVATTIGMSLMIHSFRDSVVNWLKRRLDADLYIYSPDQSAGNRSPLPSALGRRIGALPGVAAVGSVRYLRLSTDQGFLRIHAYDLPPSAFAAFDLLEKAPGDPWAAFQFQAGVMVSEAFANLNGVHPGSQITLPTARGPQPFQVVAVFLDYNAGGGIVAMSRATYDRFWSDSGVSTFWVYLAPGVDPSPVVQQIRTLNEGRLEISDNRALLRLSMEIFDRAFTVTAVLRWLATGVAFVGIFSALLALQLERTRELGVLRALGLTPGQLWTQIVAETGLLGGVAGLLAWPTGILTGWVLTEVINKRAFGWTLALIPAWESLGLGLGLAVLAGLLAGLYPAWRMARTRPAEALRCE